MSPFEFTAIKLALSSSMALLLSFILENHAVLHLEGKNKESWWDALAHYPIESLGLLFCGGIFVLIFQVNITWLAKITSAVAVGIVGEVKVVPQYLINAIFNLKVDIQPENIVGSVLSIAGSVLYAIAASLPRRLTISSKAGFEWRPRDQAREQFLAADPVSQTSLVETESGQIV